MKILRNIFIGLACVILGVYACAKITYPTAMFRYKLTAEVMTPQGLKTGSSVIEVSYTHFYSLSGSPNLIRSVTGEALFIDLGSGKNFIITLTSGESGRQTEKEPSAPSFNGALNPLDLPIKVLNLNWPNGRDGAESILAKQVEALRGKEPATVPLGFLPTTVMFRNINDPDSVEVVQPESLSQSFGEGYALVKATLQITDEMPAERIEGILTWLPEKKPKDGDVFWSAKDPLIDRLHYISFKQPIE